MVGKAIAAGVPLGAYGMTRDVAAVLEPEESASWDEQVATGGTLFANALSLAAARATLAEVLTEEAYEHSAALGARLADGIEAAAAANGCVAGPPALQPLRYTHAPDLPANAVEARASFDLELYNLQRLYMANRGVWEAIDSAGPACGIQTAARRRPLPGAAGRLPGRAHAQCRCATAMSVRVTASVSGMLTHSSAAWAPSPPGPNSTVGMPAAAMNAESAQ